MRCKAPDKRTLTELKELNAAFLALIIDPGLNWHGPLLGMNSGITAGIRALSPRELDFIAATPCLLPGFESLGPPDRVADSSPDDRPADAAWLDAARLFATELVMYQWHMARQHPLVAALCMGPATGPVSRLANMGFREIQDCARPAVYQLRARFARHCRFWPDLIRAARSSDTEFRCLTRLAIIPLSVAEGRPVVRR
jgi:hypothetical protein